MPERRRIDARRVPDGYPHGPAAAVASAHALDALADPGAIVLVEGVSDQIAVDTLARRLGATGLSVVPVGGAQGLRRMLVAVGVRHPAAVLSGLYDVAEERVIRYALESAGLLEPDEPVERAGFFACRADLEDELIRACGAELVEACIARVGDARAFRKMQKQPEWRTRSATDQLRRWLASGARRKLRYAQILVEAVALDRMPEPLVSLIERASTGRQA